MILHLAISGLVCQRVRVSAWGSVFSPFMCHLLLLLLPSSCGFHCHCHVVLVLVIDDAAEVLLVGKPIWQPACRRIRRRSRVENQERVKTNKTSQIIIVETKLNTPSIVLSPCELVYQIEPWDCETVHLIPQLANVPLAPGAELGQPNDPEHSLLRINWGRHWGKSKFHAVFCHKYSQTHQHRLQTKNYINTNVCANRKVHIHNLHTLHYHYCIHCRYMYIYIYIINSIYIYICKFM